MIFNYAEDSLIIVHSLFRIKGYYDSCRGFSINNAFNFWELEHILVVGYELKRGW